MGGDKHKCKKSSQKENLKKKRKNFKSKQLVTVWLKKDSHKSETAGGGSSLDKIADNFCQLFWVHFSAFDLVQLCLEGASDTQLSQPAHKQTTLQWLIQGKGKQVSGGASPLS